MSEFRLPNPVQKIVSRGKITADDITYLASKVFPVGLTSDEDVMTLLAVQNSCSELCDEWSDFFVESVSNYIVSYVAPHGELNDANAAWLRRMLSTGGVLRTPLEIECLLRALDISVSVPEALSCLALEQLRLAMVERRGGYLSMRSTTRPGITRGDLDYINRVLVNRLVKTQNGLTAKELGLLSAIDQAVAHAFNDPAWRSFILSLRLNVEAGAPTQVQWGQTAGSSLWKQIDAA